MRNGSKLIQRSLSLQGGTIEMATVPSRKRTLSQRSSRTPSFLAAQPQDKKPEVSYQASVKARVLEGASEQKIFVEPKDGAKGCSTVVGRQNLIPYK